jgi:hypothetical protein
VATQYFLDTSTAVASVKALWTAVSGYFPGDVTITVDPTGDIIEDTTGAITGAWSSSPVAQVVGGGTGAYSAPSGALFTWHTATILDGRRLRGRNFIVPIVASAYNGSGQLLETVRADMQARALEFIIEQEASAVVWHRPLEGPRPVGGGPRPHLRDGGHGLITSGTVSGKAAVLRSRRD